ncbi:MAG: hypothetical protein U0X20_08950 [Caldilineaceae bacterium]
MASRALIAGVGMIPFVKPGANESYPVMAGQAANLALADAEIGYEQIQHAYVGYVYGDSTCGQRALYELGMTGIPIFNVNNNCSTGSTALYLARQAVEAGVVECALALGFEQMAPGALDYAFPDRPAPLERFTHEGRTSLSRAEGAHGHPALWRGGAGVPGEVRYTHRDLCQDQREGTQAAAHNRRAIFRKPVTVEEVLASPHVWQPDRLQCCPPTCRAAAAVVVSRHLQRHGLAANVAIAAQARPPTTARPLTSTACSRSSAMTPKSRAAARPGIRAQRHRPGGSRRRRAARLLHRQRGDLL